MEIERRFLVKNLKGLNLNQYKSKHITQDYIYRDMFTTIRTRKTTFENETKYFYTIKTDKKKYTVNELEKDISKEEYLKIYKNPNNTQISKTRYLIPYNEYTIELDVFENEYEGIIFAEIEFTDEKQAVEFVPPEWFDKELSSKITNSMMATMNMEEIKRRLNEE